VKVLLINSDEGPDYLADLVNYFFLTQNFDVYTNHTLHYLFDDFQNPENLYGKGFTLYAKLDYKLKEKITEINTPAFKGDFNNFDKIIFTSIFRKYKNIPLREDFFNLINKEIKSKEIIVLDGEDIQKIDEVIANKTNYFKRELSSQYGNLAKPISFTYPKLELPNQVKLLSEKTQLLAPMDPRYLNSYIFNELDYLEQYSRSIFGTTTKKSGWDCMRHYEILSRGTLLYFPGVEEKPGLTMNNFPTLSQIEVNNLFKRLITGYENIDSSEKIRMQYDTKNYFYRGIKKVKSKLSKMNLIENNMKNIEDFRKEYQFWFQEWGTTDSYKKIFDL
tara:strand:+ start:8012 stop:9010 length:999 start_codon:yes stop_codon:yes gene_type:complete